MRLYVCAAVFVFATWRRVPRSDGTAVGARDETAFSSFDTFSLTRCIDWAARVASPLAAVEWAGGCTCVHVHACACVFSPAYDICIHTFTSIRLMNK